MRFQGLIDPIESEDFFHRYWEQEHVHIKRASPTYYKDLLRVESLDDALSGHAIRTSDIRFARESRVILGDVAGFRGNRTLDGIVDPRAALKSFNQGWTLVFQQIQRWHPPANHLCADIFDFINHSAQCNVYLAPPNSYGFGPHFDTHDVVILQFHGRKKWKLYSQQAELPLPDHAKSTSAIADDDECIELVLEQGDALYIPRGRVHDADSLDDVSGHITLGLLSFTWHDLISDILRRVTSNNVEFRKSLPPGFFNGDGMPALKGKVRELVTALADEAENGPLLHRYRKRDFSNRGVARQSVGGLTDSVCSYSLRPSTKLKTKSCCPFKICEVDDDTMAIESCSKTVLFPARLRETMDCLLQQSQFSVNEIPDLDEESKLVLCQRLIQEGVFTVLEL